MTETRLGVLLFTQAAEWSELEAGARRVDELGYDHLWAWDHLYAIFGDPYQPIFEGYLTLAAWAKVTTRVRLGLLVGAVHVPEPGARREEPHDARPPERWTRDRGARRRLVRPRARGRRDRLRQRLRPAARLARRGVRGDPPAARRRGRHVARGRPLRARRVPRSCRRPSSRTCRS